MCLFSRLFSSFKIFQMSFFCFRREGLNVEGFSIRERKFDLRESLSLGSDSFP